MLEARSLTVRYGALTIVDGVSFRAQDGRWLMIVGPNGAGKSTIVNALSQGVPYRGEVLLDGVSARRKKPRELARAMGVLSQSHAVGYAFTVEEIVRLGRYAFAPGVFSARGDEGEEKIARAIEMTGLEPLIHQSVLTLSGGELQRAFLAQLLAQDPQIMLLDEPTNHLDLAYQKQVFDLIAMWKRETGRCVISVVHDLSLARAYGDDALLLDRGRAVAFGPIEEALAPEHLEKAYAMDVYGWMKRMLEQWNGEGRACS